MTAQTTIIGNVTRDPELRFTPNGAAVATFGVAVNRRWQNRTGDWDEKVSFFDVVAWRDLGEHVTESIQKGMRVIVVGRLDQRTWETDQGDKRSKIELVADSIGPDLRWAIAMVEKVERQGTDPGPEQTRSTPQRQAPPAGGYNDDEEPF